MKLWNDLMPLIWTPPPPSLPSLQAGDISLWAIDLRALPADYDGLLSPEERKRADRFLRAEEARQFRAAHGALRAILALHTGRPAPLAFSRREHGQPVLDPPSPIEFSLSHSYRFGLVAVTCGRSIGVDIEHLRLVAEATTIARDFFSTEESMRIAAEPEPNRPFLAYWTLKEAVVKATGEGFRRPLSSFTIVPDTNGTYKMVSFDGESDVSWSLLSFEPMPDAIGAVAVIGPINRVWCWRL